MIRNLRRSLRYAAVIIAIALIGIAAAPAGTANAAPVIGTNARAAALIDVTSGRLLYSSNGDTPMRIASLTKIMTAIVAIENGNLSDVVKTPKRAVGREGSSIYLQLGEEMTLHNMLYGLMLRSGNDAATAIAEHVGGSEAGFVHLMNDKAAFIGLANSSFRNPHGLDEDDHYSSANDLAKLSAYALKNEAFAEIVRTKMKQVPNPHDGWNYAWKNKNKMLTMYEGADGVKTGYTKKSFRCLVSSATRGGQQLAAVTINDGDDWADHRNLLDWGFRHYPLQTIAEQGEMIAGYPYALGRDFRYPLEESEQGIIHTKLTLVDPSSTDYALGERGTLAFQIDGNTVGSVPIYEPESVRMKLLR
ncbi:D-alanyl-D-alanine carboxypeptidase family protein [Paenibacillus sp. LHD-117]|uniref:D-alanyl-D-alanine carboxypeptidase family protein n=1 Tax=Paenibacillus sp. LHD-117 TaxID=3071412 RepID=UPI0027DF230B|nr:D-alanyl-D-alanine carboxypeptidase family protein [Paenibacillus sp. LHD-117]MDQ6418278.1 D-alanyl-D-alanine carboxypeptidase family protein [Paenibacillus sp. LHD-117]